MNAAKEEKVTGDLNGPAIGAQSDGFRSRRLNTNQRLCHDGNIKVRICAGT